MKKVLIIDDELDMCLMLKAYLQKRNFLTNYACTLNEGLMALKNLKPDAIILDNNLPDGQGLSKISSIKKEFPETQLILISAMCSIHETAIKLGADFFIEKPFKLQQISQLLQYTDKAF